MYCRKCGHSIPDDSLFCTNCGESVDWVMPEKPDQNGVKDIPTPAEQSLKARFSSFIQNHGLLLGMSIALILIGLGFVLHSHVKPVSVQLSQFANVDFSGYNGEGRAEVRIDSQKFIRQYGDSIQFRPGLDVESDSSDLSGCNQFLNMYFDYEIFPQKKLSNGDYVKVHWNGDPVDAFRKFHVTLICDDIAVEVQNLPEKR